MEMLPYQNVSIPPVIKTIKLQIRVYSAYILSVLLYSKTYHCQENCLSSFYFRCLHSILGVLWREHIRNLYSLYATGSYDLITILWQQHLCWLDHIHRNGGGCLPNNIPL